MVCEGTSLGLGFETIQESYTSQRHTKLKMAATQQDQTDLKNAEEEKKSERNNLRQM